MPDIRLVRVDFRLMHGQVVTAWLKQVSANAILIVDDQLAAEKFLAQVFLMAKPQGVKVAIRSVEKAVAAFQKGVFGNEKMLILFKTVESVKRAYDLGFPLEKLQLGGLGNGTDKVMISKELSLNEEEVEKLLDMQDKGVEITLQMTPRDSVIKLDDAVKMVHEHTKE